MAGTKKVLPGQVEKAKKLLQGLPTKDVGITRTEFAATLDKDIRKALNKGYSLKDISALLKKEGISMPASLLKEHLSSAQKEQSGKPQKSAQENSRKVSGRETLSITPDSSEL